MKLLRVVGCALGLITLCAGARADLQSVVLTDGWRLEEAPKVSEQGSAVSLASADVTSWHKAVVPGTVLTSLVADGTYPDPMYGENNRPAIIPETLARQDYWYRIAANVPESYAGRRIWLNFDGINYASQIWVNGTRVGSTRGAFIRSRFDITGCAQAGKVAVIAVRVSPQPHPGVSHEHTMINGVGLNGGESAIDGPAFLCSIGWDWIPAIRDRDAGLWGRAYLSATGEVVLKDPQVTSELELPSKASADLTVAVTVTNVSDRPIEAMLTTTIESRAFEVPVQLKAGESKRVVATPRSQPALHIKNPRLWWPNGYGPQERYPLTLEASSRGTLSDREGLLFGIRRIEYSVPESGNLTLVVNGVRVFARGGNWGMDDAMKRIPRARMEAMIRLHALANYTIIRNWVGQSTSEDFYDLCDQYGLLIWDEFFQPNPGDGPNPTDLDTYLANVRDKILRYRNHPSIAIWCARNEGPPPPRIEAALRPMMAELDPQRHYQPSSTDGAGVYSHGPYYWRAPREFYTYGPKDVFKTESGSLSVPTLESIHGMMPKKDWEVINDDWAEHDFARGAQNGNTYRYTLADRYGPIRNLADFVRKAQLANYEAYRAMYEGRLATLFRPSTALITWMSNPAQPSFVWQLYHHDLEPSASLFATRHACEMVHVQLNERDGDIEVVNHEGAPFHGSVEATIYRLDGQVSDHRTLGVDAKESASLSLGALRTAPAQEISIVRLVLSDAAGRERSRNVYWIGAAGKPDTLEGLGALPRAQVSIETSSEEAGKSVRVHVRLHNDSAVVALMTHLQLRRGADGFRVLPVYYSDNYISLMPGEQRDLDIEAAKSDVGFATPTLAVDGWNFTLGSSNGPVKAAANREADPLESPETGLPMYYGPAKASYAIHCGGKAVEGFAQDTFNCCGVPFKASAAIASVPGAAPRALYQSGIQGRCWYTFPVLLGLRYRVVLHFAEPGSAKAGERRFNVSVNGVEVLSELDVEKEAGGAGIPLVKTLDSVIPDRDGLIVVQLSGAGHGEPEINGIEIRKSGA